MPALLNFLFPHGKKYLHNPFSSLKGISHYPVLSVLCKSTPELLALTAVSAP